MSEQAIQRSHSPDNFNRLKRATDDMSTNPPCLARTTVSFNEQPSPKWISSVRRSFSASGNPLHLRSAPSSLAFSSQPKGKKRSNTDQSSSPKQPSCSFMSATSRAAIQYITRACNSYVNAYAPSGSSMRFYQIPSVGWHPRLLLDSPFGAGYPCAV